MIPDSVFIRVSFFLAQRLLKADSSDVLRCHSIWRNACLSAPMATKSPSASSSCTSKMIPPMNRISYGGRDAGKAQSHRSATVTDPSQFGFELFDARQAVHGPGDSFPGSGDHDEKDPWRALIRFMQMACKPIADGMHGVRKVRSGLLDSGVRLRDERTLLTRSRDHGPVFPLPVHDVRHAVTRCQDTCARYQRALARRKSRPA